VWGQDRLWLLAQKLCERVNQESQGSKA
jgi:hypothetical protein